MRSFKGFLVFVLTLIVFLPLRLDGQMWATIPIGIGFGWWVSQLYLSYLMRRTERDRESS